jgi:hypothetical protein
MFSKSANVHIHQVKSHKNQAMLTFLDFKTEIFKFKRYQWLPLQLEFRDVFHVLFGPYIPETRDQIY